MCAQLRKQFQAELGQNPALPGGTLRILDNHLFFPVSKNTQNWHGRATGNILFPDVRGDQQKGIVSPKPVFFFFLLCALKAILTCTVTSSSLSFSVSNSPWENSRPSE